MHTYVCTYGHNRYPVVVAAFDAKCSVVYCLVIQMICFWTSHLICYSLLTDNVGPSFEPVNGWFVSSK